MLEYLSHDMRSPQVAILALTRDRQATLPEPERMRRIAALAQRTLRLADDFVQLSRLSELALEREEIDLAALVEEALDRAWPAARDKAMHLVRDWPDQPVPLHADGHVLSRALDNLVDNAVRHGPRGSRVVVSLRYRGGRVSLSIRDEGPGMPEARRRQPFQRFGPCSAGRGTPGGGASGGPSGGQSGGTSAGLGLSFVKLAVDKHGGRIGCRSRPGRGTAFVLHLDAALAE